MEWPSQSPDLNPIEMLWHDLKQSFHAWKHANEAELKQLCKEEWPKFLHSDVKDSLPVITNAGLQLLLRRVAQPVITFRGQFFFYVVPCRFGQILSLTWNHYFKTAFCIYSGYLCVILKFVWWSESIKCDKYAKNKNRKGAKKIHTTVCAQFSWMIKWTLFILIKYSIQGFNILFITYTIIQNVTSSEM